MTTNSFIQSLTNVYCESVTDRVLVLGTRSVVNKESAFIELTF